MTYFCKCSLLALGLIAVSEAGPIRRSVPTVLTCTDHVLSFENNSRGDIIEKVPFLVDGEEYNVKFKTSASTAGSFPVVFDHKYPVGCCQQNEDGKTIDELLQDDPSFVCDTDCSCGSSTPCDEGDIDLIIGDSRDLYVAGQMCDGRFYEAYGFNNSVSVVGNRYGLIVPQFTPEPEKTCRGPNDIVGATLTFDFSEFTDKHFVRLFAGDFIDIEAGEAENDGTQFEVTYVDNDIVTYPAGGLGDNSYEKIELVKTIAFDKSAELFEVKFQGSGAIGELTFQTCFEEEIPCPPSCPTNHIPTGDEYCLVEDCGNCCEDITCPEEAIEAKSSKTGGSADDLGYYGIILNGVFDECDVETQKLGFDFKNVVIAIQDEGKALSITGLTHARSDNKVTFGFFDINVLIPGNFQLVDGNFIEGESFDNMKYIGALTQVEEDGKSIDEPMVIELQTKSASDNTYSFRCEASQSDPNCNGWLMHRVSKTGALVPEQCKSCEYEHHTYSDFRFVQTQECRPNPNPETEKQRCCQLNGCPSNQLPTDMEFCATDDCANCCEELPMCTGSCSEGETPVEGMKYCDGIDDCTNCCEELPMCTGSCSEGETPVEGMKYCDGIDDCTNCCEELPECTGSCPEGETPVEDMKYCDGIDDCTNCCEELPECTGTCPEGETPVEGMEYCDGIDDCTNCCEELPVCTGSCPEGETPVENMEYCDGIDDCTNCCEELPVCTESCPEGETPFEGMKYCDGIDDCTNCCEELPVCTESCPEGEMPVEDMKYCDGIDDCTNCCEELPVCTGSCPEGETPVEGMKYCDGIDDCTNCCEELPVCTGSCPEGETPVEGMKYCDGIDDCTNCCEELPVCAESCPEGEIPVEGMKYCDGIDDCTNCCEVKCPEDPLCPTNTDVNPRLGADKYYSYYFEFESTVAGDDRVFSCQGTSLENTATCDLTSQGGPSFPVHISCSDKFEDGYGSKDGPKEEDKVKVTTLDVLKYDSNDGDCPKACVSESSCAENNDPNPLLQGLKKYNSYVFDFKSTIDDSTYTCSGTSTSNNVVCDLSDQNGPSFTIHTSCSDLFEDGLGSTEGPSSSDNVLVTNFQIFKYKEKDACPKICQPERPTPPSPCLPTSPTPICPSDCNTCYEFSNNKCHTGKGHNTQEKCDEKGSGYLWCDDSVPTPPPTTCPSDCNTCYEFSNNKCHTGKGHNTQEKCDEKGSGYLWCDDSIPTSPPTTCPSDCNTCYEFSNNKCHTGKGHNTQEKCDEKGSGYLWCDDSTSQTPTTPPTPPTDGCPAVQGDDQAKRGYSFIFADIKNPEVIFSVQGYTVEKQKPVVEIQLPGYPVFDAHVSCSDDFQPEGFGNSDGPARSDGVYVKSFVIYKYGKNEGDECERNCFGTFSQP